MGLVVLSRDSSRRTKETEQRGPPQSKNYLSRIPEERKRMESQEVGVGWQLAVKSEIRPRTGNVVRAKEEIKPYLAGMHRK